MHSFAVRLVVLSRQRKCSTITGRVLFTFDSTTIMERVSDSAPPSPWNLSAYWPCVATMPSKPVRKSTCQKARRNSPSVTACSPAASCIATALRMLRSSICSRSWREMLLFLYLSRAAFNSAGRSRLPTWSARKGGFTAPSLQWETAQELLDLAPGDAAVGVAKAALVLDRESALPAVDLLGGAALDIVLRAPAEVAGDRRGAGMQPDVVAVERQPAEQRVHRRDDPHHGERAEEEGEPARVHLRAGDAALRVVGLPGGEAQGADGDVGGAMHDVHREQAQQVAVESGDPDRRRIRRRRRERGRYHAEQPGAQIRDTDEQRERCGSYSCLPLRRGPTGQTRGQDALRPRV